MNPANAFQPPYLRWSMRHARADGEAKASARAVGSTAAFSAMASAVLAALPG
ncbi:hypothetical protein [Pseudomonas sp. KU43P]|uniref:hypothetical protein n=1 Tax=Pseudomonas sp. KU43P TaxID=2487887 RepID=UPI002955BDE2|nr:hypothetical protein [Pseudomonas sp. KU43P]